MSSIVGTSPQHALDLSLALADLEEAGKIQDGWRRQK